MGQSPPQRVPLNQTKLHVRQFPPPSHLLKKSTSRSPQISEAQGQMSPPPQTFPNTQGRMSPPHTSPHPQPQMLQCQTSSNPTGQMSPPTGSSHPQQHNFIAQSNQAS